MQPILNQRTLLTIGTNYDITKKRLLGGHNYGRKNRKIRKNRKKKIKKR